MASGQTVREIDEFAHFHDRYVILPRKRAAFNGSSSSTHGTIAWVQRFWTAARIAAPVRTPGMRSMGVVSLIFSFLLVVSVGSAEARRKATAKERAAIAARFDAPAKCARIWVSTVDHHWAGYAFDGTTPIRRLQAGRVGWHRNSALAEGRMADRDGRQQLRLSSAKDASQGRQGPSREVLREAMTHNCAPKG
jgi:hypothetical protein